MIDIQQWLIDTKQATFREILVDPKQTYLRVSQEVEKDIFATTDYTEEVPLMFKYLYELRLKLACIIDKEQEWADDGKINDYYDRMEDCYGGNEPEE